MGVLFATFYDRLMRSAERRSLGRLRHHLLSPLEGDILELGAGTGANLEHYGEGVRNLTLTEPSASMRSRLERKARESEHAERVRIHDARAETLPFEDASFDAVTSTLVLCSVRDQAKALQEIRRVLRPDGVLAVIEHVRHDGASRFLQHSLDPVWRLCADGCRLIRQTGQAIEDAGFRFEQRTSPALEPGTPFLRELLVGRAVR
ncbi:MAG: class I SAM-dependent methyltransferase [Planctomycetota bacterium]